MSENHASENHDAAADSPSFNEQTSRKLYRNFLLGVLTGLVPVAFEYFILRGDRPRLAAATASTITLVDLVLLAILAYHAFMIWAHSRQHIREHFSLCALLITVLLSILVLVSLVSSVLPWDVFGTLLRVALGQQPSVPQARWTDHGFLILICFLVYLGLASMHARWDGLESVQQHRARASANRHFLKEGLSEIKRVLESKTPLRPYRQPDARDFVKPPPPLTQSEAWHEQARELLELSCSSYVFNPDSGWHSSAGCWMGTNTDNQGLVFLYPSHSAVSQHDLKAFVRYAGQVSKHKCTQAKELIVLVRDEISAISESRKGVRCETQASLLKHLIDFTDYRNAVRKRVEIETLQDSHLTLSDVYIVSRFCLPDGRTVRDNVEQYLLDWLEEPGHRHLALLGQYGQGKSTAALMLTYHLLCENQQLPRRIPILLELRGKSPRHMTPLELLATWAVRYNINPRALLKLHFAGRLLLIFEGFDEMALVGDEEMRRSHFAALWKFRHPKAKLLITGRPNVFFDDEEMKKALGIVEPAADGSYCEAIRLQPFSIPQIERSTTPFGPTVTSEICSLARESSGFQALVSRPSLLHIVAALWHRENLSQQVQTLNSAYVMGLFVRRSFRPQWLKPPTDTSEVPFLMYPEQQYFMKGVAAYMAANRLPNQITGAQLDSVIADLIEAAPDSISIDVPAIFGGPASPLRARIREKEYGLQLVQTQVRAGALLVDDIAAPGTFRFAHKSFMEYLFAAVADEHINCENSQVAESILTVTGASLHEILSLPVSIEFLAELTQTAELGGEQRPRTTNGGREISTEALFASSLLRAILGRPEPLDYLLRRVGIFRFASVVSTVHLRPDKRVLLAALQSSAIVCSLNALPVILHSLADSVCPHWLLVTVIPMILWLITTMLWFGSWMGLMERQDVEGFESIRDSIALWQIMCNEVGVQDHVLHRICGTHILPWARHSEFRYFCADRPWAWPTDIDERILRGSLFFEMLGTATPIAILDLDLPRLFLDIVRFAAT